MVEDEILRHTGQSSPVYQEQALLSYLRLHTFGAKTSGLRLYGDLVASTDSPAWSYHYRHRSVLPGCTHRHCGNRWIAADRWRQRLRRASLLTNLATEHALAA